MSEVALRGPDHSEYEHDEGAERPFFVVPKNGEVSPTVLNGYRTIVEAKLAKDEVERKKAEWDRNNDIFHTAEIIGAQYLEANGDLPTPKVMESLFIRGYISYSPEEIMESGVFYDWEDFQNFAKLRHEADIAAREQKKEEILAEIYAKLDSGELPAILSVETIHYRDHKDDDNDTDNEQSATRHAKYFKNRAVFTSRRVSNDELILRYVKYQIASQFVVEKIDEDGHKQKRVQDPELRRINIALGVNIEDGKVLNKGYVQEILGSNSSITKEDITESEIYKEWYDVLHAKDKSRYLKELLKNARPLPEPKYYYDRQTRQIVVLGGVALSNFILGPEAPYLNWLNSRKMLSFALRPNELKKGREEGDVVQLRDLFTEGHINRHNDQRNRYVDLSKDLYKSYGFLLVKLADGVDGRVINIARDLNIGPGPWLIRNTFGSLPVFFEEIGAKTKMESISSWSPSLISQYVEEVFNEYGEISIPLLRRLYKDKPLERPSVYAIQSQFPGGLTTVLENKGLPSPLTKKIDPEKLVGLGVEFTELRGRLPITSEIRSFASAITIQKYFGSIKKFKAQIAIRLGQRNITQEEAEAA